MYKSFVSLGRYIPKYFILFVAMVNGIVSFESAFNSGYPDSIPGSYTQWNITQQ